MILPLSSGPVGRAHPAQLGTDNETKWQPVPSFGNLTRL